MFQLIRKISAITLACLLALNLATGAGVVVAHCSTTMIGSHPMDMDHCDGLLNFAFPMQGCCGECNDIFCDLAKNPLQDVNAANSNTFQNIYYPFLMASLDAIDECSTRAAMSEPNYKLYSTQILSPVPLYIEHLSLII